MATKIVGGVAVDLIARTAKWIDGFRKAQAHSNNFEKAISRSATRIAKYAASYLAVRKLVSAFSEQSRAIDSVAKASDRLGIATEQLTRFQYAAQLSGSSSEGLAKGLEYMQRAIGKAGMGLRETAEAFRQIGLTAADLKRMNTAEQFKAIADGISRTGDSALRAEVMVRIFGESGAALQNMMLRGRAGLEALGKEADQLGLVFSRIEARQVEMANDALIRTGAIFRGLMTQVVIKMAPYIEAAAKSFSTWAMAGAGAGERVLGVMEWIAKATAYVANAIDLLRVPFYALGSAVSAIASTVLDGFGYVVRGVEWMSQAIDSVVLHWKKADRLLLQGLYDVTMAIYKQTGGAVGEDLLTYFGLSIREADRAVKEFEKTLGGPSSIGAFADDVERLAEGLGQKATDGATMAAEAWERVYSGERLEAVKAWFNEVRTEAQQTAAVQIEEQNKVAAETQRTSAQVIRLTQQETRQRQALYRQFGSSVLSVLNDIVQNSNMSAREQFEAAKALRAAECVMNTAAAVMSYNAMTPPRPGMAASMLILGGVQLATILGTTFEGGGTVSTAAAAMPAQEETSTAASARAMPTVNLVLSGSGRYSRDEVISMFEAFNEALGDGFVLNVS